MLKFMPVQCSILEIMYCDNCTPDMLISFYLLVSWCAKLTKALIET